MGAAFPPLAAQGEANAPGNAEGADGIEFLRAKMLFKIFFFASIAQRLFVSQDKRVRTEEETGILLFWLQGLCMLTNYQKGPSPPKSPAVRGAPAATHPLRCHLWL